MTHVTASDLARALHVTRTRVGQYVHEGKLTGCYLGEGRERRFDLDKVGAALGRSLHPGQMLGNGAETRKALVSLKTGKPIEASARNETKPAPVVNGASDEPQNSARYDIARTQKAEEEVRKLRRMNAEAEGKYVLATEVELQTARAIAQEIAQIEGMLRDAARKLADKLGLDFRVVRQILADHWREHRQERTVVQSAQAEVAEMTPEEEMADI